MEDTQDRPDAATRKRRSSILKSQRPPRTPFCDLEFNVSTPPDTTKSRRVSFSRRTGVAEFVTNEATTTWKNFYEEHNKSLESSGNDSDANGVKQTVGHLGKRIFDEQFEEVETMDFIGGPNPGINISTSINTINFGLECTDKLTAPKNNFELSAFTEHRSKVFGDDLVAPCVGEMSNCIDVNFSAIQQIGDKDDLDDIHRDFQQQGTNVVSHDFYNARQNLSEYIEVDLNVTHVAMRHDESDMSITDIINSPKVQDVSKSCSIDKKVKVDKDWVADKENIAINPYVAPKESLNFAINDEPDNVLVFDGKKLIVQRENNKPPERKTIILNCDDDLPNFIENVQTSKNASGMLGLSELNQDYVLRGDEFAPFNKFNESQKKHASIIYDDDLSNISNISEACDISVTQVLPNNIIRGITSDKRKTIVYEDDGGNVSLTQAIPNIVIKENTASDKRRTILYENDTGDISVTQALSTNIIVNEISNISEACDISVTQVLPNNIIRGITSDKRKTIVYEDDGGNVSLTQAIPNIVIKENTASDKRRTILYENDTGDISVTQALSTNIIVNENAPLPEGRRMLVLGSESNSKSFTQAVSRNIIVSQESNTAQHADVSDISLNQSLAEMARGRSVICNNNSENISITQGVVNPINDPNMKDSKRRTVVFENDDADISMTQAVNLNCVILGLVNKPENISKSPTDDTVAVRRQTIIFENNAADISVTQAVNLNHVFPSVLAEQNHEINTEKHITETTNTALNKSVIDNRKITSVVHENCNNITITQMNPASIIIPKAETRKTILFEDNNILMTKAVPTYIIAENRDQLIEVDKLTNDNYQEQKKESDNNYKTGILDVSMTNVEVMDPLSYKDNELSIAKLMSQKVNIKQDIVLLDDTTNLSKSKPIPIDLPSLQNPSIKSYNKDSLSKPEANLMDVTNGVSDILVYQTVTVNNQNQNQTPIIDKGDCKSQDSNETRDSPDNQRSSTNVIGDEISVSNSAQMSNEVQTNKPENVPDEQCDPIGESKCSTETLKELKTKVLDEQCESIGDMDQSTETVEQLKPNKSDEQQPVIESKPSTETVELKDCAVDSLQVNSNQKESLLNDLLDMSNASLVCDGIDDKNIMAKIESQTSVRNTDKPAMEKASKDTLFYIIGDDDGENKDVDKNVQKNNNSPLAIEFTAEEPDVVEDLQNKLTKLKTALKDDKNLNNRHYEKICSPDIENTKNSEIPKNDPPSRSSKKSFKLANDTNELLEIISDFTDKRLSTHLDPHLEEDEEKPEPILIKGHLALENKSEIPERIGPPRRLSKVFSREELLHSLSIAALHKSAFDLDDSADMDDTLENTPRQEEPCKKTVRMSTDVVKTLKFEDESFTENTIDAAINREPSPLRKTAVGEMLYTKEKKAKVIPDYLKDVSDGIKELMDDLVKPMADVLPFEAIGVNKNLKRNPSTCSTQIQANLVTSSQIDVNDGLYSNPDSYTEVNKISSLEIINDALQRSLYHTSKSPIKSSMTSQSFKSLEMDIDSDEAPPVKPPKKPCEVEQQGNVIIFDPTNPLNNILLPPPEALEIHKYNPVPAMEVISEAETKSSNSNVPEINSVNLDSTTGSKPKADNEGDIERVSAQYHIESANTKSSDESQSGISIGRKPMSMDQFTEVLNNVATAKVNTIIAMKGNKELLAASSSLTLVEDELGRSAFDVHVDSSTIINKKSNKKSRSPVKIIYNKPEDCPEKLDSEVTSNDEIDSEKHNKAHKRNYSPTQRENRQSTSNCEVTPKPASKIQKISNSPAYDDNHSQNNTILKAEKDESPSVTKDKKSDKKSEKKSKKSKNKSGKTVTVQQLLTEYNVVDVDHDSLKSQIKVVLTNSKASSLESRPPTGFISDEGASDGALSSCVSSKNMREEGSVTSHKSSRMDWQADIDDVSSKSLITDCESSVNVVAKIDMLPFMGSPECEWESSCGDTWSFRLLHSRLRLVVRLVHRHDNAARSRVRADTPVKHIALDIVYHDTKNAIASLCVQFAASSMRTACSQCGAAGDVPALLRRAAAAARLAVRWARAMHDAVNRLALYIDRDGRVSLKVANVPLRSVWEVRMKVEMCTDVVPPHPAVRQVHIATVLGGAGLNLRSDHLAALPPAPADWGHAPKTIWRIFKYLKHMKRTDDFAIKV